MRALVVDPTSEVGFQFADVREPTVGPNQMLIDVRHISLNHGDLNDARSGRVPPGAVLGSDVAGIVVEAETSGAGPGVGTPVVGVTSGAFATRAVVDIGAVVEVPDTVDLAATVTLPVAGLAALQALRAGGVAPGKRVLITGASGGVGLFAVQLARHWGAEVVAAVGSSSRTELLRRLGAANVVTDLADVSEPVDLVIESVGGPLLVAAWDLLAAGGSLQSVGWTSGQPATFEPYSTIGAPKSLTSFLIGGDVASDLAELVALLADRTLEVFIGWRGPWDHYQQAATDLAERRVQGKAILDVK